MTRRDAIALLTRNYDAFNRSDNQGILACLSGDVAHDINQGSRQTVLACWIRAQHKGERRQPRTAPLQEFHPPDTQLTVPMKASA